METDKKSELASGLADIANKYISHHFAAMQEVERYESGPAREETCYAVS